MNKCIECGSRKLRKPNYKYCYECWKKRKKTRPKYYYRSFAVIYILVFLFVFYSAINGVPYGWFLVILMILVSSYWIIKAWKEYSNTFKP